MVAADVADFITIERIDSDNAKFQSVLPPQHFDLFSNPIGHEIKDSRRIIIFGKRPGILLAGKISPVTIPQNDVNSMSFEHIFM